MFKLVQRVMSVGMVVLLAACSSGGNVKMLSSTAATGLPAHPSVRLIVNPVDKDSSDVVTDVSAAILGQLQATGRYSKVVVNAEPTDLLMTVDIVKYSKVTVGERLLVGVFAGRNRINTQVTIVQSGTNATLRSYEADGESAAHPLSSESGVSDAVREAAKQVAAGAVI